MPYCPDCLMEYRDGVDICSDCGAKLVPGSLPKSVENPDDQIDAVLLLKADSVMQAKFLADALDAAGIPYVARGLGITDSLGGSVGGDVAFGVYSSPRGPEIFVNPNDLAAARELLESIRGSELTEDQDTGDDSGNSSSDSR